MSIGRQIVIEERALVRRYAGNHGIAAVGYIGKGYHLSTGSGDDTVHLAVAFNAEGTAGNGFVSYIHQRIRRIAVPFVIDLLDGPFMAQVLEDVLALEASGEVALLLIPVRVIVVMIQVGYLLSVLSTEVLLAVRKQETVCIVVSRVPHHGSVGCHLHKEFAYVARIHNAEGKGALGLHVAVVGLHLPRAFRRCQVGACGIELQVHVVAQFHMVGVLPVYYVVKRIMVSSSCHEGPQHIGGYRGLDIALGQ